MRGYTFQVYFLYHESFVLSSDNIIACPDGLAVDWINNKIYFTDAGLDIVGVFDPVGFHYRVLVRSDATAEPRAIVLDPFNRQVLK